MPLPRLAGFQQQMDLGIVPQGLKVADALHRRRRWSPGSRRPRRRKPISMPNRSRISRCRTSICTSPMS